MRTILKDGERKIKDVIFPLLAKFIGEEEGRGDIVLFSDKTNGTLIHKAKKSEYILGEHSSSYGSCLEERNWQIIDYPITITFEP